MEGMPRTYRQWVIDTAILLLVVAVLLSYVLLNIPQSTNHIVKIGLDDIVPRIPFFAIPYLAFLPWTWLTLIYVWYKNICFRQLAYSFIAINLIAFFVYLTFQTYVPRDLIVKNDIFSNILRFIYNNDLPYAGLPSLHSALSASIATYFVIRQSKYSWLAITAAALIITSTLFIKQHFVLDAVSGILLGIMVTWGVFRLVNNKKDCR